MYKTWSPFGQDLEYFPGIDVKINSRNVSIVVSYWRSEHCFYAFEITFNNALVNIQVIDESNFLYSSANWPKSEDFKGNSSIEKPTASPIWVDTSSKRIKFYKASDPELNLYTSIDSYYFCGQAIIVLLDVESIKPRIKVLNPKALN